MPTSERPGGFDGEADSLLGRYELIVDSTGAVPGEQQPMFTAKLLLLCASRLSSTAELHDLVGIARRDLPNTAGGLS